MTELLIICAIGYIVANYLWARSISDKLKQVEREVGRIRDNRYLDNRINDLSERYTAQLIFNDDIKLRINELVKVKKAKKK